MTWKAWVDAGWIRPVSPDPDLIAKLMAGAREDLRQAQLEVLSSGWRLIIAYTAILNAATAALMAEGYRADRDQHHFRTLQSMQFSIELDARTLRRVDGFRKKRHASTYDNAGSVSDQEVKEITELGSQVLQMIDAWLKNKHPELGPVT